MAESRTDAHRVAEFNSLDSATGTTGVRITLPTALSALLAAIQLLAAGAAFSGPDGTWVPIQQPSWALGPVDRHFGAAIFDPVGRRLYYYGGTDGSSHYDSNVWSRGLAGDDAWRIESTQGTPPSTRVQPGGIYDSRRHRMIVVGGECPSHQLETWALSLDGPMTWSQIVPGGGPQPSRSAMVAIYDSLRDRVVIATGYEPDSANVSSGYTNDVWALPLGDPTPTWMRLDVTPPHPDRRAYSCGIYDPVRDQLVLFSGTGLRYLTDLEAFPLAPGGRWSGRVAFPPPGFHDRWTSSAVYDPGQDQMLVFGGYYEGDVSCNCVPNVLADLWSYQFSSRTWTQLPYDGLSSPSRYTHSAVFDPVTRCMWVIGGMDLATGQGELLKLQLGAMPHWSQLDGVPAARVHPAAAYVPPHHELVVTGGLLGSANLADVWSMDLANPAPWWRSESPSGVWPQARYAHSAVYDSRRDRLLLFGGFTDDYVNDTWSLALGPPMQWNQVPALDPPAARAYHRAYYDPAGDRMIVVGGSTPNPVNEVWQLLLSDPPTWTQLAVSGPAPPERMMHAMTYDPLYNRLLVFGGQSNAGLLNDLWALSLASPPSWQNVTPAGPAPIPRVLATMVTDAARGRAILFGGILPGLTVLSDTWELTLGPSPAWRPLAPGGPTVWRSGHVAIEDDQGDRMLIFAGHDPNTTADATALEWGGLPTPVVAASGDLDVLPGMIRAIWDAPALGGRTVTILRRTTTTPWIALTHSVPSRDGRIVYDDASVEPNTRYGYALDDGSGLQAELWGTSAGDARLAFTRPIPNPVRGALDVQFEARMGAPVVLEIFDLAGRKQWRREWPAGAGGAFSARVGDVGQLPPGIYHLELTQSSERVIRRIAVIR